MKILSPRAHGYLDVLAVIGFLAGPRILEFEGTPATIAYALGGLHMLVTLATDFPFGVAKVLPMPLHGLIEFAVSILLFAMPWIAGFAEVEPARCFFLGAGAFVLLAFLITDYTRGR